MLGQLGPVSRIVHSSVMPPTAKANRSVVDDTSKNELASGLAALSICESLLTSLQELKIIGAHEAVDILKDASSAHHQATIAADAPKAHRAAAAVIDRMIVGKNSVRHS